MIVKKNMFLVLTLSFLALESCAPHKKVFIMAPQAGQGNGIVYKTAPDTIFGRYVL